MKGGLWGFLKQQWSAVVRPPQNEAVAHEMDGSNPTMVDDDADDPAPRESRR